ncbi:NADPH:quinone oxidoreductase family protein [Flavisphingomonas formosensis]|uniref:NADPH:quinone oxidoreductase family protein n=1 Tax=Flavisphingomonas formosensis TaxID=861534 RepID=UPI0012F71506|nr:NADPH:quinone oxidoreductase family protein [Sphingomonas formosensis]
MKAVQVLRHGDPADVVAVAETAIPDVGPGEVRVAVSAASLNFGDIARARGGVATVMAQPPFTLGMDVCGVVEATGAGGEAWLGRRVVGMTKMAFGGMAEQAIVPLASLFDAPPELDDAEATAFLLPFHTSYLALQLRAKLQAGEALLITGAASGVGTAAVQLGAAAGAQVIALAGGPEKGRYCESLGAAASIDHRQDDLFDRVMDLTSGRGVDVAFDLVGGELTEPIWTCMAREGRYLPVGFNGDSQGGLGGKPLRKVSIGNFSVLGVMLAYGMAVGPMRRMGMNPHPPEIGQQVHAALCDLVAAGRIRPAIGQRIRMNAVGAALADHEARKTSGRTVVDIAGS